jgi:phosphoesterase RecJ-like protein
LRDGTHRRAFHELVAKRTRFLLTTHLNPDGDGMGSEVAMAIWLGRLGKTVHILNDSVVPPAFLFLTRMFPMDVYEPELAEARFAEAEALVVLDTSNRQRIGRLGALIDRHAIDVAIIDHHVSHNGFGRVNVIEPEAAATGEIVYDLMREASADFTPEVAEALYVALMTDTGSFRYSNTDSAAHRMAAELLAHGIDPQRIHARVHAHASASRLRFFGEVLSAMELVSDGRIVVLEASPEQFQKHGLVGADTEGLVDMPRNIAGVESVALFSEVEAGKVKVSLRSTGRIAIDSVCSRLGGGGHPHAAGVLLRGTREAAKARVIPEIERLVAGLESSAAGGGA